MERRSLESFTARHHLDSRSLCAQILEAREGAIAVRSAEAATDNLTRIIEATLRLANRKGFAAMTLRELARESGLSLGGLYAYIGSKDELARLIQSWVSRTLRRVMAHVLEDIHDSHARLASAIEAHLLTTEALREWFFFLYMEAHHLAADERRQAVAAERNSEQIFADIIRQGQAEGRYGGMDADIAAGLLKAMLQDWYLKRHKHGERGLDVSAYADIVTAAAEALLQASDKTKTTTHG
ncbi:TetR family transcriptional regulator [Salinisphaera sp. T5B8]|uniref:TetR/AcrR family transcriptional regulator n=1 Tax=Salinisphaera sp. T5B8 TaxID=1304154 RepID=UPI00334203FB